jgi:nucleotide-binding universal stress UspA family protein
MLANILCPIEFTTLSHHALERAATMARTFGAAVTGIHVVTETVAPVTSGATRPATAENLASVRGRVLALLREANAPRPTAVAILGDPAAEIVHLAVALPADLIVMPSYSRNGSADGTGRSVTEQVLCHAPSPVILVPDAAGGQRQGSGRRISSDRVWNRFLAGVAESPAVCP